MKKESETDRRVKKLLADLGKNQAYLAERIRVTPSRVSEWLAGKGKPTPEAYLSMGNLASDLNDRLWFWGQAGLDEKKLLATAAQVKESAPEMVAVLLSKLPSETRLVVVDEKLVGGIFSEGDILVLVPATDPRNPGPFWNQIVLFEFDPSYKRPRGFAYESWPTGLFMGRLRYKWYQPSSQRLQYQATVGPFNDTEEAWNSMSQSIVIGSYRHPGPPKEPVKGSERERAQKEVQQAHAAYDEEREREVKRRGSVFTVTIEIEGRKKALEQARMRLTAAEGAEMREAEREAKEQAPENIRLYEGCRILDRVIAWFSASEIGQ